MPDTRSTRAAGGRLLAVLGVLAILGPVTAPTLAAQDLEQVEAQVEALEAELTAATQAFMDVRGRVEATEHQLAELEQRATRLEAQAAEADAALAERAREVFKHGGNPVFASFLSSEGVVGAIERTQFLNALNGRDRARLQEAIALRAELDQTETLIQDRAAELASLEQVLAERRAVLEGKLGEMQALAAELRAVVARQREIDNAVMNGVYACIHDVNSFVDSWGAARVGHRHEGVDVMAPYGVPVYAFTNGVITRMNQGGLGGTQLYLFGDDGNEYFYAHLSGYADSVYVGRRVEAGEVIAYNGASGNASRSAPHVHFEVHPGGGGSVNPYPYMAAAC